MFLAAARLRRIAVTGVGGESDQQGPELTPLMRAQRPEQLALGEPGRLAGPVHGPAAIGGELDAVSPPVGFD